MLELFLSFLGSLGANVVSYLGRFVKVDAKKVYEKRVEIFENKISPFILNTLLKKRNKTIYNKLGSIDIDDDTIKLPYVDLGNENTELLRNIDIAKKNFCENSNLIEWLKNDLGKKLFNGSTYTVSSLTHTNKVMPSIGDYFSTQSTSDIHYYNLIRYFPNRLNFVTKFLYMYSSSTKKWLDSLDKIVVNHDFSHYTASIGCSVLTLMKTRHDEYKIIIIENSSEKGAGSGKKHVVPSFMFGPVLKKPDEQNLELNLQMAIVKEFGEELLDLQECESYSSVEALMSIIESNPLLKNLNDGINDINKGDFLLMQTGFVLDLYRLRPEFTFLLIINDTQYFDKIRVNWEANGNHLNSTRGIGVVNINDRESINALFSEDSSGLCAPGLAALNKGLPKIYEYLRSPRYEIPTS